jgi:4a-hydroxytetrahydrobiopterin dehydratase
MFARTILRRASIRPVAFRPFSLLVPLQSRAEMPADLMTTPLSDAAFAKLDAEHAAFNELCATQLQEMNDNLYDNIVARGGFEGWTLAEDNSCMTKSFHFASFEDANIFVQAVGHIADKKDHHPEWSTANGGKTLVVRLTSHFADNTVTRKDFELGEAMNKQEALLEKNLHFPSSFFKVIGPGSPSTQFPAYSNSQWATFQIAFASAVLGAVAFKICTGTNHRMRENAPTYGALQSELKHSHVVP